MQQKIDLIKLDTQNMEHLKSMYGVRTHPEVACHLTHAPPVNFSEHVNYLQHLKPHKRIYLIQSGSSFCGFCQLTSSEKEVEIGMALHPDYSGRGVGSQALHLLLEKIQSDEDTKNKIPILFVKKENARAIALYLKYGFKIIEHEDDQGLYLMKKI